MRTITRLALTFALTLGWLAPAPAQETEEAEQAREPRFEEEMVVSEVLLDAVVTDKQGRVILGLGKDDFVVRENGREVEIAGVSFYSSQQPVGEASVEVPGFDLSEIPADRHFILFLQEPRSGGRALSRLRLRQQQAGRALEEWVTTGLDPADVVAVVSYDFKLKVHQDFTRDRERLVGAIRRAVRGVDPESEWPSRQPPESEIGPLRRGLPAGKELRKETKNVYRGLQLLARAAAAVPGRKNLVFVGPGFDAIRSTEYHRMWPTVEALNDANIAAYTLDLVPTGIEHTSRASLQNLAIATGGDFYFTFVRFGAPLEQIARGTTGYYLIAYRTERPAGESGYQRVKVDVVNPELRVQARAGYSYGG